MNLVYGIAVGLAGGLIGVSIGMVLQRRRNDRRRWSGRTESALRVVSGSQEGVSHRWRQVIAAPSLGMLTIRRYWLWYPKTRTIEILDVENAPRRPTASERIWLNPAVRIIRLRSPSAVLEWAVVDRHLTWALDGLRRRGESGDQPCPA